MHAATIPDHRQHQHPGGSCLEDLDRRWTSAQFAAEVRRVAAGLAEHGIRAGDVVGAMLPNRLELVTLLFATWRLGAALTPVNPALTAEEACYQLDDCAARLVVADDDNLAKVTPARAAVLTLDNYRALTGTPPDLRAEDSDVALIVYTRDLGRSRAFYEQKLALPLVSAADEELAYDAGTALLVLRCAADDGVLLPEEHDDASDVVFLADDAASER